MLWLRQSGWSRSRAGRARLVATTWRDRLAGGCRLQESISPSSPRNAPAPQTGGNLPSRWLWCATSSTARRGRGVGGVAFAHRSGRGEWLNSAPAPDLPATLPMGGRPKWRGPGRGFQRAAEIYFQRARQRTDMLLQAAMPVAVIALGVLILIQSLRDGRDRELPERSRSVE